jgi:hypothetical protein
MGCDKVKCLTCERDNEAFVNTIMKLRIPLTSRETLKQVADYHLILKILHPEIQGRVKVFLDLRDLVLLFLQTAHSLKFNNRRIVSFLTYLVAPTY